MKFELATVISCSPGGCSVVPVAGGPAFDARYSDLILNRVKIHPGQLVAVDLEPQVPEVAWRWYPARIVELSDDRVIVQERERQLSATRVPGLGTTGNVGDEVWVTGMEGVWELQDNIQDGKPAHPSLLRESVFPRITVLLSGSNQA